MSKKQQKAPVPATKPLSVQTRQTRNEAHAKKIFEPVQVNYNYILAIVAALGALGLYANTFNHDYVLDDQAAITYNNYVQEGFAGIPKLMKVDFWYFMNLSLGYYRPLSLITFAIEHEFVGANNPHISHMGNAGFYALTAYVLCLLLQRWFNNRNAWFGFLITMLFISFPAHTEVVANIKSRDEILSFLNMSATLLLFTTYLDTHKLKYLWWSLLTAYLAYLSKESSIIMMGIFPLVAYYLRGRSIGQAIVNTLPYFGVTLVFFIQKKIMLGSLGGQPPMDIMVYPYFVEKTRFLSMFKQFANYLRILVFPHPLVYDYSYNQLPSGRINDPVSWLGMFSFGGLVYAGWVGFKRRTLWGFGLALFFATLFPALAFTIARGGIMAERFLYAPALAWSILLAWGVFHFLKSDDDAQKTTGQWFAANALPAGILIVFLSLYSLKTVLRNPAWAEEFTLFTADEAATRKNTNARKHYGDSCIKKYQVEKDPKRKAFLFSEGVRSLHEAISIYPQYGEAHFGLGFAYHYASPQPRFDSAAYYYKLAIKLTPRFVVAYNNLGVINELSGRVNVASYWYNKAVEVNPNYQNAIANQTRLRNAGIDVRMLPDSLLKY